MRTLLFTVLLVCYVQAVFDSGLKYHMFKMLEKLTRLESSSIGRAIIHLAELGSRSKGQFDFSKLWAAIDELAEGLQESKEEENTLFETDRQQYGSDVQFYSNQITEFENEVAQLKVDIEDFTATRTSFEATLVSKNRELEETKKQIQQTEKTIAHNEVLFKAQSDDYDFAVTVIDQAIEILSQVQESSSFLQHNKERVAKAGDSLQEGLTKIQKSHRIFFQPLVKHFVLMAEQGFADQQLLKKVFDSLESLRASLVANKQVLANNYETEKNGNEEILQEYNDKQDDLADVIIPQVSQDIEQKNGEIVTKKGILNDATNNYNDAQDALKATEERWLQRRQKVHTELVAEYDNDLAVVNDAVNALQRGGITRS